MKPISNLLDIESPSHLLTVSVAREPDVEIARILHQVVGILRPAVLKQYSNFACGPGFKSKLRCEPGDKIRREETLIKSLQLSS